MKLVEELANPSSLGNDVSHSTVLSLGAGARYRVLPLRRLGDEVVTEVDAETQRGTSSVGAASPVGIGVGDHGSR
jgi:hypothetical protein